MPVPVTLSLDYNALLSTTMMKYQASLTDNISKEHLIFYMMKQNGLWKTVTDIGERAAFPLLYELGNPDSYDAYDQLDTTPMEGITTVFFDWRQASVPISISGKEELQNRGEERILNLLEAKITQAESGIKEFFSKALIQGNGMVTGLGTDISTARVSPLNGSSFIDPLPLLVKPDPTTSTTIGSLNQQSVNAQGEAFWKNQLTDSSATTYVGFLQELRHLYNLCSQGVGGRPDVHVTDLTSYELYEQALAAYHQNPSYQKADIPFENTQFKGKPVVWDENMIDGKTPAVNATTKGTWFMLNSKFLEMQIQSSRNFATTPFIRPENQDARTAQVLWLGAFGVKNRKKQGIMIDIARTLS
jgi:hypothetical protein